MEADSHDSVGVVEGFFDSVSMVDVNIEVQHAWVDLQQLQDAEDYVVDVAETTGLCFPGVVETAHPVDCYIALASDDQVRCVDAASCGQLAVVEQSFEARTVKALVNLEDLAQLDILKKPSLLKFKASIVGLDNLGAFWVDPSLEVLDVLRMVEAAKFFWGCRLAVKHVEARGEPVVVDEAVDHFEPHGLHGMPLTESELGEVLIVEVADLPHRNGNYYTSR